MAEISYTQLSTPESQDFRGVVIYQWPNMANGDTGQPLRMPRFADRSVEVDGTFGAGGTVAVKGSNAGSSYKTLADPNGNDLSITTSKIETVLDPTQYIRPEVTAGDGTTSLTVTIMVRG